MPLIEVAQIASKPFTDAFLMKDLIGTHDPFWAFFTFVLMCVPYIVMKVLHAYNALNFGTKPEECSHPHEHAMCIPGNLLELDPREQCYTLLSVDSMSG